MLFPTVASLGLFAALASASQHAPHNRRHYNASFSSTTLTVYATSVYTIISCPATVTDCPAHQATHKQVITRTVGAYTTICPVGEASAVSSSVLSSYSASATSTIHGSALTPMRPGYPVKLYPTATNETTPCPLGTGVPPKGEVYPNPKGEIYPNPKGEIYPNPNGPETVLTYTLGSGTSTSVVTTTIKKTKTATSTIELTSTVTDIVTHTRYITVVPAPHAPITPGVPGSPKCVPVTVTVTQPAVCVTPPAYTAYPKPAYPIDTGDNSGKVPSVPGAESYPADSAPNGGTVVYVSTATVVPVPYQHNRAPYSNGTLSTNNKKPCASNFPSGYVGSSITSRTVTATGLYPITPMSSKPTGVAPPNGAYPGYPAKAAPCSSSSTTQGPATTPTPTVYPVDRYPVDPYHT